MTPTRRLVQSLKILTCASSAALFFGCEDRAPTGDMAPSARAAEEDFITPYTGPSVDGIDTSSLEGKVYTGYQGWFNTPDDGAGANWFHWSKRFDEPFEPGNVSVDMWPDVSEYEPDELYDTGFKYKDGTTAQVFSSYNKKTVLRHFKWMSEYGIDGAFVQRFTVRLWDDNLFHKRTRALSSAREGANRYGVSYAVMYDLSGTRENRIDVAFEDWQRLVKTMDMGKDPAYQMHNGKPLVAIWGIGFDGRDKRRPSLALCKELIQKFKDAGCSVMLGIPTGWRNQESDSSQDPLLHEVLLMADILSPWSVGRYTNPEEARQHADHFWKGDIAWTQERDMGYIPVVFPGFSWHNLYGGELDFIPRLRGKFLWEQVLATKKAGAETLYLAMFDEVDEGTAIFKVSDNPPTGNGGTFLGLEGLPSDFYLKLAGKAGALYRGEIEADPNIPVALAEESN